MLIFIVNCGLFYFSSDVLSSLCLFVFLLATLAYHLLLNFDIMLGTDFIFLVHVSGVSVFLRASRKHFQMTSFTV